jgi:hypothetical protein
MDALQKTLITPAAAVADVLASVAYAVGPLLLAPWGVRCSATRVHESWRMNVP